MSNYFNSLNLIAKLKKQNLLTYSLIWISIFTLASNLYSERVNICNKKTYAQSSGTACSFNSQLGEDIIVWAKYGETPGIEIAYYSLTPFIYNEVAVDGIQETLVKRIFWNQNLPTKVLYNIPNFGPNRYIELEVYADRTNLKANESYVDIETGNIVLRYAVTTQTPFNPVASVSLKAWASNYHNHKGQLLGTWYPSVCFGKGDCSGRLTHLFKNRHSIDRGKDKLEIFIDEENTQAETDDSDPNNHITLNLGDFFIENIPTIMGNLTYNKSKNFMNDWFDIGVKTKRSEINGIDWDLQTFVSGSTNWFLNPSNASNQRIINKFNELTNQSYYFTQNFKNELKRQLKDKFTDGVQTVQLSKPYVDGDDIKTYHRQHAQNITAQVISLTTPLDHVTNAFGSFSFYLVPQGTATILNSEQYRVTINNLAIHVVDSYDFNGYQLLGCWGLPDKLWRFHFPGLKCFVNESFRIYRNLKARGYDYNIFTKPKIITFSSPHVFPLNRN